MRHNDVFLAFWITLMNIWIQFPEGKKKSCNKIYVLIQKIKIYYLDNVVISNYCYNFWNNLKISREGHIWCLVEWHLLEKWNILCSVLSTRWGGGDGGVHKNHDKLGFYLQNTWKICPIKASTYPLFSPCVADSSFKFYIIYFYWALLSAQYFSMCFKKQNMKQFI